jgi:hypothetical protein
MTAVEDFKREAKASESEQIQNTMCSLLAADVVGCTSNIG